MPLSETDILQANQGSFEGTSGSATLPVGTTSGSVLLLAVGWGGTAATPAGFTRASESQSTGAPCVLWWKTAAADETSWTITSPASAPISWYVEEWTPGVLDTVALVDAVPSGVQAGGSGTTATSDTTPRSTTYDGVAYALHAGYMSADTNPVTWSGHTGGFTEIAEVGASGAVKSLGMSVSRQFTQALGTFQSTATASASTTNWGAAVVVLTAAGAKKEPNIAFFWSFPDELIGAAGLATGLTGSRYWDAQVGSPAITASGLQLSASAAAETITSQSISTTGITIKAALVRVKLRFDSALPGADVELARIGVGASNGPAVLTYRTASQKLGLKIGTGTEQLSDATVAADTFYAVDLRLLGTTTAYTCDWQVDYGAGLVAQTQATFTANTGFADWTLQLGWPTAATATVTYAYALCSAIAGHHPLGEHTFAFLKVDPAGTPTVSGTSSSFRRFTSNGTIDGAFDAAAIRDALDEWPPVVGASADGLAVVTAHATDYIELPMQTYQAAPAGSIRAVRPLLPMWAASATAATCKVNGWDGSASAALFLEQDPTADNSSDPAWICAMWRPTGGWTQAKLDAAAIRFGSNDATPDIGPHAVGMEVAVQLTRQDPLFGELSASLRVEQRTDPLSAGIIALDAYTPAEQSATLRYELGGVEQNPVNVAAGSNPHTVTIDAADATVVTRIEFEPSG